MSYFSEKDYEWRQQKWGCFSASEAFKLIVPGKGELFSEGGHTYIKRIAREACTLYNEEDRGFKSIAMQNGTAKEPESFFHLEKLLGFDGLQYMGGGEPEFKFLNPDVGCSPDAIAPLSDGRISFGCELKNPTGDTHFGYLIDEKDQIKDWMDLKQKQIKYYTQIQTSLLCYGCDHWIFASYNEYFQFKDRMLIIEVPRDVNFINNLEVRFAQAVKKKYELVERLMNRK